MAVQEADAPPEENDVVPQDPVLCAANDQDGEAAGAISRPEDNEDSTREHSPSPVPGSSGSDASVGNPKTRQQHQANAVPLTPTSSTNALVQPPCQATQNAALDALIGDPVSEQNQPPESGPSRTDTSTADADDVIACGSSGVLQGTLQQSEPNESLLFQEASQGLNAENSTGEISSEQQQQELQQQQQQDDIAEDASRERKGRRGNVSRRK